MKTFIDNKRIWKSILGLTGSQRRDFKTEGIWAEFWRDGKDGNSLRWTAREQRCLGDKRMLEDLHCGLKEKLWLWSKNENSQSLCVSNMWNKAELRVKNDQTHLHVWLNDHRWRILYSVHVSIFPDCWAVFASPGAAWWLRGSACSSAGRPGSGVCWSTGGRRGRNGQTLGQRPGVKRRGWTQLSPAGCPCWTSHLWCFWTCFV